MITVVGNLKGGSGKSTVAFNLAVWLAHHGKRVMAFDLDPQRTLTDVSEVRSEEGYTPLFSLHFGGEDLVESLKEKDAEVIVDVGTSDMSAMKSALSVAERILIPVAPSQADIWSTQKFISIINKIVSKKNPPEICVFVNRADTHVGIRESDETEEALAELSGTTLLNTRLHQRTAYRRSFSEGLGVFELKPSTKASKEFKRFATLLYPECK